MRNFWALNVDEAIVAEEIQRIFRKQAQVFFPLNAQLKDVDLLLVNPENGKTISIQVKGSKAFEPHGRAELERFGNNSVGYFSIPKKKIKKCNADYFIFLLHVITDDFKKGRKKFSTHLLSIPPTKLDLICRKKRPSKNVYRFYMVVDRDNKASDRREAGVIIPLTRYLDSNGLEPLWRKLGLRRRKP